MEIHFIWSILVDPHFHILPPWPSSACNPIVSNGFTKFLPVCAYIYRVPGWQIFWTMKQNELELDIMDTWWNDKVKIYVHSHQTQDCNLFSILNSRALLLYLWKKIFIEYPVQFIIRKIINEKTCGVINGCY